jgi:prepilin-type N-terminal cleavage/methylation domain-containing protein
MKKGFTLIELLIVIAIIGILAGILFVSIGQTPLQQSRDSKRTSDLQNIRTALTLYYNDNSSYPATLSLLQPNYIPAEPVDPRSNVASGFCTAFTPNVPSTASPAFTIGDFGYRYDQSGTGDQGYVLQACLEDSGNPALATDCDTTSGIDPVCSADVNVYDIHS